MTKKASESVKIDKMKEYLVFPEDSFRNTIKEEERIQLMLEAQANRKKKVTRK